MNYSWRFAPVEPGPEVAGFDRPPSFSSQSDAESWLGEVWRDLAAAGVASVTLVCDGEVVYDMSLSPDPRG